MPNGAALPYKEFAAKIKEKYPQYAGVDDLELSRKIVEKYPQYKTKVIIEETTEVSPVGKTTGGTPPSSKESETPTTPQKSTSPTSGTLGYSVKQTSTGEPQQQPTVEENKYQALKKERQESTNLFQENVKKRGEQISANYQERLMADPKVQEAQTKILQEKQDVLAQRAELLNAKIQSGEMTKEAAEADLKKWDEITSKRIQSRIDSDPEIEKLKVKYNTEAKTEFEDYYNRAARTQTLVDKQLVNEMGKSYGAWESVGNSLINELTTIGKLPRQYQMVLGQIVEDEAGTEMIKESYKSIKEGEEDYLPTKPIVASLEEGNYADAVAGAAGVTINFLGSVARGIATGGTSPMVEMTAPQLVAAIDAKAASTGLTPEEVIVQDLEDEATAMTIGTMMGLAERTGMDDAVKAAKNFGKTQVAKDIVKQQIKKEAPAIYTALKKATVTAPKMATKEALTESIQGGLEAAATPTLETDRTLFSEKGTKAFWEGIREYAQSPEAMETLVGSFIGAGTLGLAMGGGRTVKLTDIKDFSKVDASQYYDISVQLKDKGKVFEDVDVAVSKGQLTEKEAEAFKEGVNRFVYVDSQIPTNVQLADRPKAHQKLQEKLTLDQEIEGKDKSLAAPLIEKRKEVEQELINIVAPELTEQDGQTKETKSGTVRDTKTPEAVPAQEEVTPIETTQAEDVLETITVEMAAKKSPVAEPTPEQSVLQERIEALPATKKKAANVIKRQKLGGFGNKLTSMVNIPIEFIPDSIVEPYLDSVDFISKFNRQTIDKKTGASSVHSDPEFKQKVAFLEQLAISMDARLGAYNVLAEEVNTKLKEGAQLEDVLAELKIEGKINEQEAEFFRNRPLKRVKPPREVNPPAIKEASKITIPSGKLTERGNEIIRTLKGITEDDIKMLGEKAAFLPEMAASVNAGFIPASAVKLSREIEQNRKATAISESIKAPNNSFMAQLRGYKNTLFAGGNTRKKIINQSETANIGKNIDASLGLKGDNVHKLLYDTNRAFSQVANKVAPIAAEIDAVLETISPRSSVKQVADIRAMMFVVQRQKNSNPNDPTVDSVKAFVDKSTETESVRAKVIEDLGEDYYNTVLATYEKYKDPNGELNANALYKDLSVAERKMVNLQIRFAKESEKVAQDAANENGRMFIPVNSYAHIPVLTSTIEGHDRDAKRIEELISNGGSFSRISTNAGTIKARTKGTPVPIFSIRQSIVSGAEETYTDYFLTRPLLIESGTLNKVNQMLKDTPEATVMAETLRSTVKAHRNIQLSSNALKENLPAIWIYMTRASVGSMLATTKKFTLEIATNSLALATRAISQGRVPFKYYAKSMSNPLKFNRVLQTLVPSQIDRLLHGDVVGGQASDVDLGRPNQYSPFRRTTATKVANWANKYVRNWGGVKGLKTLSPAGFERLAVQTPDKIMARDLFFYGFETKFQEITGQLPDYDRIEKQDTEYLRHNADALKEATRNGDSEVETLQSSTNPADKSLTQKQNLKKGLLYHASHFMLPFSINDYQNLRAAVLNGNPKDIGQTALPIFTRQMVYTWAAGEFARVVTAALFGDDEDWEEVSNTIFQGDDLTRAALSATISLIILKDMNSWKRVPVVAAIEWLNYLYGEGFLRQEGEEYNKYENSILYNSTPVGYEAQKSDMFDHAKTLTQLTLPALSPGINAVEHIYKVGAENPDEFLSQYTSYQDMTDNQRYHFTKGLLAMFAASGAMQKDWENVVTWEYNKEAIMSEERPTTGGEETISPAEIEEIEALIQSTK
jgi:hypothetical protein